ncbi:MAG: hypothetical protein RIB46_11760 [Pseudomonadales bacterium]|jgi:hypothetical protein
MRKQFTSKRRACALCKPHKRGWARRWTASDQAARRDAEREIRAAAAERAPA